MCFYFSFEVFFFIARHSIFCSFSQRLFFPPCVCSSPRFFLDFSDWRRFTQIRRDLPRFIQIHSDSLRFAEIHWDLGRHDPDFLRFAESENLKLPFFREILRNFLISTNLTPKKFRLFKSLKSSIFFEIFQIREIWTPIFWDSWDSESHESQKHFKA